MDEIKRALESAEHIPLRNLVVHLGERDDAWSPRTIEFAADRAGAPGRLCPPARRPPAGRKSAERGHHPRTSGPYPRNGPPDNVGVCLDLGHAHITVGTAEAIATLGNRIASVHVHDNHGEKDEHLWPGDGTIDWPATVKALKALASPPATVLEISNTLPDAPATLPSRIEQAFALLE